MQVEFAIAAWAAFAPGMASSAEWKHWAAQPYALADLATAQHAQAPVASMPALLRRRLGPLGRMAAEVAYACDPSERSMPVVLASRYGDASRSLVLLNDHARGDPVSPTDFALSVHNAVGAVISIARKDTSHYSSVAGGIASAAAGVIEAVALMDDGAPEVLLVHYDAPLPPHYARFADEPADAYAWAWRITPPQPGAPSFTLEMGAGGPAAAPVRPFGLDALRFSLSEAPALSRIADGRRWTWRRHG